MCAYKVPIYIFHLVSKNDYYFNIMANFEDLVKNYEK